MKFMHVADVAYPHIGGVEYVVYRYSKMQTERGHSAVVVSSLMKGVPRRESMEGVKYIRLSKASLAISVPRMVKKMKPDLVHTHSYISALSLSFLWRINPRIPILRHIHDIYIGKLEEYSGWGAAGVYKNVEKILVKLKYTGYIVPSRYTKNMLIKIGLSADEINIVHPGVDINKFGKSNGKYVRKKHGIPEEKKIIGFVGRLSTGKGPQYLINAAKDLDAYVILVGPNPDPRTSGIVGIREYLERKVREYGMKRRVIFAGKVKEYELPLYYDSFDIFCLPSLSEGFGMSIAEALAAGKPVVSFRTAAIPEIVKHGYNGLLAEVKNVDELREHLRALLTDENLYGKLSSNARKSVEKYSWENSYRSLMSTYARYL